MNITSYFHVRQLVACRRRRQRKSPKRTSPPKCLQPYRAANSREGERDFQKLKTSSMIRMCPPVGGPNPKPRGKSFFHQKVKEKLRGETRISLEKVRLCLGSHFTVHIQSRRTTMRVRVCLVCVFIKY